MFNIPDNLRIKRLNETVNQYPINSIIGFYKGDNLIFGQVINYLEVPHSVCLNVKQLHDNEYFQVDPTLTFREVFKI